jgi:class 3 adenylate cyclase
VLSGKLHGRTLRSKFLRVTIPLIFLSVIGVFSVIELMTHRNAVSRMERLLDSLIRTQAAALANPLWNLDNEQIRLSLAAIVTNREILSARVLGEDGAPMSKAGAVPETASPSDLVPLSREITYDAGAGPKTIGTLEFVATRQFVWEQTRNRLLIAAVIALVAVSIEVAAALYALRTIVARPLARLLTSISHKGSSGERQPVLWNSSDELGQVIAAYNEMQAQQEEYESDLRTARDTLEQRVGERTAALAGKTKQLEQLSKQLSKYLSPQVYESIFQGRQEVKIAATRKKLTVFFSDIADFTETADRLESEELTQILNHYLTEMSEIALVHGATIDKYVGDAILIFFGDPQTRGIREDARACVRMAIAMRDRMTELQSVWRAAGIAHPLRCRMGIHTDFCTVGNFGSEDRLDYTIIGRGVNIASRLESLSAPGEILISYETYAHVEGEVACRAKGEVEVKGLAYPIETYQVRGWRDAENSESRQVADLAALIAKDPATLSESERREATARLSEVLERLSRGEGKADAAE